MNPPSPGARPRFVECGPPYSFYFQLVEPLWKARDCDSGPLHRLATLARKQGALALLVEDASDSPCVRQEMAALDDEIGKGEGTFEAVRLSFLSEMPVDDDIGTVENAALIGQCVLINHRAAGADEYGTSFVFEAFFATPSLGSDETLLNNFINHQATFDVEVAGRPFTIRGLYYAQQNGITSVCAHACIRMVVRTLLPNDPPPSTARINQLIGDTPPAEGMLPDQIEVALQALTGLEVAVVPCSAQPLSEGEQSDDESDQAAKRALTPAEYVSILTSAADSGDIALLSFGDVTSMPGGNASVPGAGEAGDDAPANHVVVIYGYTFNSDEWLPQAMPEYSGKASVQHSPASAWVDHFVIHDDNFGPYLALSSRALEKEKSVAADWIIIVRRIRTNLEAHGAEAAAAIIWKQTSADFHEVANGNQWLDYLLDYRKPLVTRPVLLTREEYLRHLGGVTAHDGSKATRAALRGLGKSLPDTLWMVELTLPDLLTGNHSKLGEVLLDAAGPGGADLSKERVSAIRVPSRLLVGDGAEGAHSIGDFPIASHVPIYQRNPTGRIW